jgi:hypothetical protein
MAADRSIAPVALRIFLCVFERKAFRTSLEASSTVTMERYQKQIIKRNLFGGIFQGEREGKDAVTIGL